MNLKTKLFIGVMALFVCVACGLFLRIGMKTSMETIIESALDGQLTVEDMVKKRELSSELEDFFNWYGPMVVDASPEVRAVMRKFDPKYRKGQVHRSEEIEQHLPTDEWIQRLLDMGVKIDDYSDYSAYLSARWRIFHAQNATEALNDLRQRYSLTSEASLDQVITAHIKDSVQLHTLTEQAMEGDSRVYGGSLSKEGVFIPKRVKTVYVEPGTIRAGLGVPEWVVYELKDREIGLPPSKEIPSDIDIIYLDEKGQPIKDRVPPSFRDSGEIKEFSSRDTDTVGGSTSEQAFLADDFDNSFPDDLPPSDTESYEFEKPKFPQSVSDLEKQLIPERIEAELSEGLSPDRVDKAQQLIDEYGTEEGLRRLREMDPDAARRFESVPRLGQGRRPSEPTRDTSDDAASTQ